MIEIELPEVPEMPDITIHCPCIEDNNITLPPLILGQPYLSDEDIQRLTQLTNQVIDG